MPGIPAAVLAQAEESDAAQAAAQAEIDNPAQPAVQAPPQNAVQTVDLHTLADRSTPAAPAVAAPVAAPVSQPNSLEEQLQHERQKNATLQGKYNAEVPILHKQVEEMKADIRALRDAPAAPQQPIAPAYQDHLSADERQEFDSRDDALGVSGRAAMGETEAMVKQFTANMNARLDKISSQIGDARQEKHEDVFWDRVEGVEAGAKAINKSPQFDDFLAQVDSVSGLTYEQLGVNAVNIGDVQRVADIVKAYKRQAGITDQSIITNVADPTSLLQPARATGTVNQPLVQQEFISTSSIEKFFQEAAGGEFGPVHLLETNPKYVAIQREIELAEKEGRIIEQ